ncbi:DUF1064 domain-containing protein [Lysinibacillus sp. FSL K6-0075]|uniref:DUF1064 domain-containing protein n=1 Tax=Lysinibacillus sp. FSL K6-0075 TaxID=2921415 RepID=UPI003158AE3E
MAKKCIYNYIEFDSETERDYFIFLINQKEKGLIKDFERQVRYVVQKGFILQGKKKLDRIYTADFVVVFNDNSKILIDVKGHLKDERNLINNTFSVLKKLTEVGENVDFAIVYRKRSRWFCKAVHTRCDYPALGLNWYKNKKIR